MTCKTILISYSRVVRSALTQDRSAKPVIDGRQLHNLDQKQLLGRFIELTSGCTSTSFTPTFLLFPFSRFAVYTIFFFFLCVQDCMSEEMRDEHVCVRSAVQEGLQDVYKQACLSVGVMSVTQAKVSQDRLKQQLGVMITNLVCDLW